MAANQSSDNKTSKFEAKIVKLAKDATNFLSWEREVDRAASLGGYSQFKLEDYNVEAKCENNSRFTYDAVLKKEIEKTEAKLKEDLQALQLKHKRSKLSLSLHADTSSPSKPPGATPRPPAAAATLFTPSPRPSRGESTVTTHEHEHEHEHEHKTDSSEQESISQTSDVNATILDSEMNDQKYKEEIQKLTDRCEKKKKRLIANAVLVRNRYDSYFVSTAILFLLVLSPVQIIKYTSEQCYII